MLFCGWRVVPDPLHLFRERYPDAELQLNPLPSLQQPEAVRSGRLDAGFLFNPPKPDRVMAGLGVAFVSVHAVRREVAARHLAAVRLAGVPIRRHFHVIHNEARTLGPSARAFVQLLAVPPCGTRPNPR